MALAVDLLAYALAARYVPATAPTLLWSIGGVLIGIPMGRFGVLLSAVAGLAVGTMIALAARAALHRWQREAAEVVAGGSMLVESLMLVAWLAGAALAYHLAEATLFAGFSGAIAAANVLLARALILPELVDLYWVADQLAQENSAAEPSQAQAAPQTAESMK